MVFLHGHKLLYSARYFRIFADVVVWHLRIVFQCLGYLFRCGGNHRIMDRDCDLNVHWDLSLLVCAIMYFGCAVDDSTLKKGLAMARLL